MDIAVGYNYTKTLSPCGETLAFDFSGVATGGNSILGYGVALSGFVLGFVTTSVYWAEDVAQMQVCLVPNLIGNTLQVTVNAYITDFDDDGPMPQTVDANTLGCQAQVSAFALVGPASDAANGCVVGNSYAMKPSNYTQMVGSNTQNYNFLSGFNFVNSGSDTSGIEISELNISSTTTMGGTGQVTLNTGAATDPSSSLTGTVDVLTMSIDTADNFVVSPCVWANAQQDDEQGLRGTLTATFNFAYDDSVTYNYVPVLTSLNVELIDCDKNETREIETVGAMITGLATINKSQNSFTISWPYALYLFNPDSGTSSYQSGQSTVTAYAILQWQASS